MPVLKIKKNGVWEDIAGSSLGDVVNGGDADTLDGKHASDFAAAGDVADLQAKVGDTSVSEQITAKVDEIKFPVTSVNQKTGAVVLTASDVGALPIGTNIPSIDGLATTGYVDEAIAKIVPPEVNLENYATKQDVENALSGKSDSNHTHAEYASTGDVSDLQNKVGDTSVSDQISNAIDEIEFPVVSINQKTGEIVLTAEDVGALPADTHIPSIDGLATTGYVDEALDGYATEIYVNNALGGKSDTTHTHSEYAAAGDVADLQAKVGDTSVSEQITAYVDKAIASKSDVGHTHTEYANKNHGNHVPATELANNAKFLRNDNTWQIVTPANIGAAAVTHGTHVTYSSANPNTDGVASAGLSDAVARSDHRHPTDTSRAAASDLAALSALVGDEPVSQQIDSKLANFSTGKTLTEHLAQESMILTSLQYGDTLPPAGIPGRIFFLRVSD